MKTILLDDRESDALQVQLEHLIELMQGTHPKNERLLYRVGLHNYVHLQSILRKLKQKPKNITSDEQHPQSLSN